MVVFMNADVQYRDEVLQKLKENDGYCPCKLDHNGDTKCKCKEFRDQVKNGIAGSCHCGLWIARND